MSRPEVEGPHGPHPPPPSSPPHPALRRLARETRLHPCEPHRAALRGGGPGPEASRIDALPGHFRCEPRHRGRGGPAARGARRGRRHPLRDPRPPRTRAELRRWDPEGPVPQGDPARSRAAPRPGRAWPTCASASTPTTATAASSTRAGPAWTTTPTLPLLAREAVTYAAAGADVVAPRAMMDGQVRRHPRGARRRGPRARRRSSPTRPRPRPPSTGPSGTPRVRTPGKGDRRGYQMDPANRARGAARGRAGPRRGGRRRHGEAGAARTWT